MSADEFASLASLIQRLRNQLWVEHIKRGALYGLVISGLFLLLAGAVHVSLLSVPTALWLPLALAMPLSGAALAVFFRRPGAATVVALFDRHGAHAELLVSAWEAYSTAVEKRSVGATTVLREASGKAPDILVPTDWVSQQQRLQWLPAYTATLWVLCLAGVFALQLPAPSARQPLPVSVAATRAEAVAALSLPSARESTAAASEGQHSFEPISAAPDTAATAAQAGEPALRIANPASLVTVEDAVATKALEVAGADSAQLSSGPAATQAASSEEGIAGNAAATDSAAATTSTGDEGGREGEREDADEPIQLRVRYADIARQISAQVNQTIAGNGSAAFLPASVAANAAANSPEPVRVATPPGVLNLRLPVAPYSTRFSVSQRAQINAYFEHLETLP